jgi:hypothetical protein
LGRGERVGGSAVRKLYRTGVGGGQCGIWKVHKGTLWNIIEEMVEHGRERSGREEEGEEGRGNGRKGETVRNTSGGGEWKERNWGGGGGSG